MSTTTSNKAALDAVKQLTSLHIMLIFNVIKY
jgi:hypothetical protein